MNQNKQKNQLFLLSIEEIAKKYEVSRAKVGELLAESIIKTFTKQLPDCILFVDVDFENGQIASKRKYTVIENAKEGEYDDFNEITLVDANKLGSFKVGDECLVEYDIFDQKNFSNQQINQIMQMFKQQLNEINNIKIYSEWESKIGQIINAEVEKEDRSGFYIINLENDNFGFLSKKETIPGEILKPGLKYKFLVKEVKEHSKGWPIILSRADPEFVNKLLEIEVPEIGSGEIRVDMVKRIAGFKSKVAISATVTTSYDPVAIVVGAKGSRIKDISNELNGEKIEVIKYSPNFKEFLVNVCGSRNLVGYKIIMPNTDQEHAQPHITLVVNDDVLPIIIGKSGYNIKLISKMLNCSIDINTIAQADNMKLEYEKVLTSNSYSRNDNNSFYNNNNNRNANRSYRGGYQNNVKQTNDDLLSDLENLSSDEMKELYSGLNNSTHSNHMPVQNDDNDLDYEDSELSNAFANEIADILNQKDDKKD